MKESAHAALTYIRSGQRCWQSPATFIRQRIFTCISRMGHSQRRPFRGVTVCTAMVSALTGTPVRRDVAMTGEISIRGRVLPIGGLKEKTMAALRHGIKTVIIPEANRRDLEEIDQTVRKSLNFITAAHVDTVLESALLLERPITACPKADGLAVAPKPSGRKPAIRQ